MVTGSTALWQVYLDDLGVQGVWGDFPKGLSEQFEGEFQQWLAEDHDTRKWGFEFVWPETTHTKFPQYMMMFPETSTVNATDLVMMRQTNQHTLKTRDVRRIPLPGAA